MSLIGTLILHVLEKKKLTFITLLDNVRVLCVCKIELFTVTKLPEQ